MRKLTQYLLVVLVALTINFALPRLAPGDPLTYFLGAEINSITAQQKAQVKQELGLNYTVWEQYTRYVTGIFKLDLGSSTKYGKPVVHVLREKLPWTLLVVLPAIVFSALIGIAGGAYAAWNRGKRRDLFLLTGFLALESMPGFWIGMLLIAIFSVHLGWLPSFGAVPLYHMGGTFSYIIEVVKHLVLPIITVTLASVGANFLLTRSSMLESLGQDYIQMAEAKGVSQRKLIFRHALRNALLPVYTRITMSLGVLVSGAVVVETVFSYPGIGRLLYESVIARDYPMMQGVFLLITLGVICANLLADLTYPLVDPRARTRITAVEDAR